MTKTRESLLQLHVLLLELSLIQDLSCAIPIQRSKTLLHYLFGTSGGLGSKNLFVLEESRKDLPPWELLTWSSSRNSRVASVEMLDKQ